MNFQKFSSLTPHNVSLHRVWLPIVLACWESLKIWISPWNEFLRENILTCLLGAKMGLICEIKKFQNISWHCLFKDFLPSVLYLSSWMWDVCHACFCLFDPNIFQQPVPSQTYSNFFLKFAKFFFWGSGVRILLTLVFKTIMSVCCQIGIRVGRCFALCICRLFAVPLGAIWGKPFPENMWYNKIKCDMHANNCYIRKWPWMRKMSLFKKMSFIGQHVTI